MALIIIVGLIVYAAGFFLAASVLLVEPGSYIRNVLVCAAWPLLAVAAVAFMTYAVGELVLTYLEYPKGKRGFRD